MKRFWVVLLLFPGCASPKLEPASRTPEDRERLHERLQEASGSPFVQGRFYAEYETGGKVVMSCRGTARGFRAGVVLIEEESKSGAPLRLLRVGDRAWVYKEGWQDTAGTPSESVGTGFQNPYDVLAALDGAGEKFIPHRQGGIECPLRDASMLRALSDRAGAQPPPDARIEGVLKAGFRDGPLVTRFSAEKGASTVWIAKMDIVSWGPAPPMRFDDIPAPFTPDMKAAVRKATEEK